MAHVVQVGVGSGGIVVLDLLLRDDRVTQLTLIEPDLYESHNVHRHLFPMSAVGRRKVELAAEWVRERRPDLTLTQLPVDLTDPTHQHAIRHAVELCDVGVCAADNEHAKYHFDALMRTARKPWTLGEVLSGGIGGWVHRFTLDGPCYGCVASHLQRSGPTDAPPSPPPDYQTPGGPITATRIPASRASISTLASLHALVTLDCLNTSLDPTPITFTSLLVMLAKVPGVFDDAYRTQKLTIAKSLTCLVCSAVPVTVEDLDVALDEALARLAHD
jgi:molybdopterin/thiamine biosynthesis adenylyltransferase